jgi:hypothetical protein
MSSETGPHPEDRAHFAEGWLPLLGRAVDDLSWLLGRDYPVESALRLIGDRHQLHARQRLAVRRVACAPEAAAARRRARVPIEALAGREVWVDGYNLLITLATARRGGLVLVGRDGALRDIASSHRLVLHPDDMLTPIAALLAGAASVTWVLDRPVSNSDLVGREITAFAAARGLPWGYRLEYDADASLIAQDSPVVTSDALILDRGQGGWVDLLTPLVDALPEAWRLTL